MLTAGFADPTVSSDTLHLTAIRQASLLVYAGQDAMRRTTAWLSLLTVGYLTPIVFMLWVRGFFPGTPIYLGHLLDLILTAPYLLAVLLSLFLTMSREGQPNPRFSLRKGWLIWPAAACVLLLFEGHGIHFAANSLAPLIDRETGPDSLVWLEQPLVLGPSASAKSKQLTPPRSV